jgi:hypothetical protein
MIEEKKNAQTQRHPENGLHIKRESLRIGLHG